MKILAIETSCDETAISIVDFNGGNSGQILSHIVSSQIALHAPYGGVVPHLAKRAHQENLPLIFKQALGESGLLESDVDVIAVTNGPGLEPALWVGVTFAEELAKKLQKPLIPINHLEGHTLSSLIKSNGKEFSISNIQFPSVVLLISGGHTELLLMKDYLQYELLGQTRDDAVGEAFDKVARLLGLPYPGGPEISALAEKFQITNIKSQTNPKFKLPRPMLKSQDFDFSFSGLKTAVRYLIQELGNLDEETKIAIAHEFEAAVTEVIVEKTRQALEEAGAQSLLVGGGVIANKKIREKLASMCEQNGFDIYLPENWITGDNATMIALAAYFRSQKPSNLLIEFDTLKAKGTLRLH